MVYCNTPQDNTVPVGITQVINCLIQAGHEVDLFDTTFYEQGFQSSAEKRRDALQYRPCNYTYEPSDLHADFINKVEEFDPAMIGFSVIEPTYELMKSLIEDIGRLKYDKKFKIAVGGIFAILASWQIQRIDEVDFICIGEGEESFVELCKRMEQGEDFSTVKGFIIKETFSNWDRKDEFWVDHPVEKLVNLDSLPISKPDLFGDRFMMKPMMGEIRRTVTIELSRGCPYKCSYCADTTLTEMFSQMGRWYRVKSVEKIRQEYDYLINTYHPEFIYKFSETFLASGKEWLKDYAEMYSQYRVPFWVESRPETLNEDNVKMLSDLNCIRLSIGLENGNEDFRRKYLNRNYTNDSLIKAGRLLRKYGISFSMNLIIGFPHETRDIIFEGINLLREILPDSISVFIYTPYAGSKLRDLCVNEKMIPGEYIVCDDYFQGKYILENNTLAKDEVEGLWRTVPLYVELPESRFPAIRQAEKDDKCFDSLKEEYYQIRGWK